MGNTQTWSRIGSVNYTREIKILEDTEYHQYNEQSITCEEQVIEQARTETISVKEEEKKDQEHKDLYWLTIP